jgi:hypothetical protein
MRFLLILLACATAAAAQNPFEEFRETNVGLREMLARPVAIVLAGRANPEEARVSVPYPGDPGHVPFVVRSQRLIIQKVVRPAAGFQLAPGQTITVTSRGIAEWYRARAAGNRERIAMERYRPAFYEMNVARRAPLFYAFIDGVAPPGPTANWPAGHLALAGAFEEPGVKPILDLLLGTSSPLPEPMRGVILHRTLRTLQDPSDLQLTMTQESPFFSSELTLRGTGQVTSVRTDPEGGRTFRQTCTIDPADRARLLALALRLPLWQHTVQYPKDASGLANTITIRAGQEQLVAREDWDSESVKTVQAFRRFFAKCPSGEAPSPGIVRLGSRPDAAPSVAPPPRIQAPVAPAPSRPPEPDKDDPVALVAALEQIPWGPVDEMGQPGVWNKTVKTLRVEYSDGRVDDTASEPPRTRDGIRAVHFRVQEASNYWALTEEWKGHLDEFALMRGILMPGVWDARASTWVRPRKSENVRRANDLRISWQHATYPRVKATGALSLEWNTLVGDLTRHSLDLEHGRQRLAELQKPPAEPPPFVKEQMAKAEQEAQRGDFNGAMRTMERIKPLVPEDPERLAKQLVRLREELAQAEPKRAAAAARLAELAKKAGAEDLHEYTRLRIEEAIAESQEYGAARRIGELTPLCRERLEARELVKAAYPRYREAALRAQEARLASIRVMGRVNERLAKQR